MSKYVIGVDFGTNSVRASLFDSSDGSAAATSIFEYPSGDNGICFKVGEPHSARQNPKDYIKGLQLILLDVLHMAKAKISGFKNTNVIGLGVGATGSTPLPVNESNIPLALLDEFRDNVDSYAWLWKDHSSAKEAAHITEVALNHRINYVKYCGNSYSSEWFWAKVLHCANVAPEVYAKAFSWVELCDYIPALLCGVRDPRLISRSACAAGHKAMYHASWGGLPDNTFLEKVHVGFSKVKENLYTNVYAANVGAGNLCREWAELTGLPEGLPIAIGLLDAHYGAIGSGVEDGVLVKIIGTSSCDCTVASMEKALPMIQGISGVVEESILPGFYGLEAGQSAVGDIFKWFQEKVCGSEISYEWLASGAAKLKPGESGLLALDWSNGCRNIYCDHELSGLLVGQTLTTTNPEIYRALMEATGFGSKMILERLQEFNIPIRKIICCGGLSQRNPVLMQIYADILNCEIVVNSSEQTCALGAGIAATVVGGAYGNLQDAIKKMVPIDDIYYLPIPENVRKYEEIYALYKAVSDAFAKGIAVDLQKVMKTLIGLKQQQLISTI